MTAEVAHEPLCREHGDPLKRPRLLEKVRGARHQDQLVRTTREQAARLLVQLDDTRILAADDEQRRRLHARKRGIAREVGAAAA
jgi:hypothetical protein